MYLLLFVMSFYTKSFAQSPREKIYTPLSPKPIGPYSQGILVNNTLYIAGQIALDTAGKMDTSDINVEIGRILHNIEHILEAAHMDFDHVVKTTIYLTDLKYFAKVNEWYANYFKHSLPARETVELKALPKGAHIEISAVAVR